jgi:hypothetical protein
MSGEPLKDRDAAWRKLLELRCQHEIVERWLQTAGVPEQLQEQLHLMLEDIELELNALEIAKRPESGSRMRHAS